MKESPSQQKKKKKKNQHQRGFTNNVFGGKGPKILQDHISNQPPKNKISHNKFCSINIMYIPNFVL
jgi:hypothetical protein